MRQCCFFLFFVLFASIPHFLLSQEFLVGFQLKGSASRAELAQRYGAFMRDGVRFYKIRYKTTDIQGRPDTASGLLVVPDGRESVYPLLCYQHGTVGERDDVPSNLRGGYQIAEVFGGLGYVSAAPDFLGLGDSRGFHPYVHAETEARAGVDMLFAVREFCERQNIAINDQLFVAGYSQGGHAAAALQRELEANYKDEFPVTASAPMSGPYSISGIMRDLILSEEEYFFPGYLVYTILSYNLAYGIYEDISQVIRPPFDAWAKAFFREQRNLGDVNQQLIDTLSSRFGKSIPGKILQDSVLQNFRSNPNHPITRALEANDVYDWAPQAPTRLYYCKGDDQVPFRNSIIADSAMRANGARDVLAVNLNDNFDHGQCVEPAVLTAAFFFLNYQRIGTTSIGKIGNTQVAAYPNPAGDFLTIEAPAGARMELFDLQGRPVRRAVFQSDRETISVQGLSAGIYLLRLETGQGNWTGRVVIGRE